MEVSNIPYKFAEPWAKNATSSYITTPIPEFTSSGTVASQDLGFPPATATPIGAGGVPPAIGDFNGVLQYITLWLQWLQGGGPVSYDAGYSASIGGYPKGATLGNASSVGSFWISTADNNTSDPDTGGANWIAFPQALILGGTAQSLQNMTASRAINTVYTNTTGRPIAVNVFGNSTSSAGDTLSLTINGTVAYIGTSTNAADEGEAVFGIVPIGATYELSNFAGTFTLENWNELR